MALLTPHVHILYTLQMGVCHERFEHVLERTSIWHVSFPQNLP